MALQTLDCRTAYLLSAEKRPSSRSGRRVRPNANGTAGDVCLAASLACNRGSRRSRARCSSAEHLGEKGRSAAPLALGHLLR
jgi:hypothetical protein